jgi:hypothetical protein
LDIESCQRGKPNLKIYNFDCACCFLPGVNDQNSDLFY